MTENRYIELQSGESDILTKEEIAEGWTFVF
jgi:hypothetical protein